MSDISISFPLWMIAWFLLGQAAPLLTIATAGLVVALVLSRSSDRVGRRRWLKLSLVIVGVAWLGGISFWAAGLVDQIRSDVYRAQHHYRLSKSTAFAGLEIPSGSWVSVDDKGSLYGIETDHGTAVSIDGALWRGDISLIPASSRTVSNRGVVKSATLAADSVIQGIPCRAGMLVEFSEYSGDLQHCTLTQRTVAAAEIADAQGRKITAKLACAAGLEIRFRTFGDRLLEGCVLAEAAKVGSVGCAAGKEIVLSGDGLTTCTLASRQWVGPFDLAAETSVGFTQGHLDRFEMSPSSTPVSVSSLDLPPGTAVRLCDRAWELGWLLVPEESHVTIAGVKLTGRMNFDCGKFEYGALFEDTLLNDRRLPRGAGVSHQDLFPPSSR